MSLQPGDLILTEHRLALDPARSHQFIFDLARRSDSVSMGWASNGSVWSR